MPLTRIHSLFLGQRPGDAPWLAHLLHGRWHARRPLQDHLVVRHPPGKGAYLSTCKHVYHNLLKTYIQPRSTKKTYPRFGFGPDAPYKIIWSSATLPDKVHMHKPANIYHYLYQTYIVLSRTKINCISGWGSGSKKRPTKPSGRPPHSRRRYICINV